MYKSVVQTVMLYRRKSLVVIYAMLNLLEGFHHRVDLQITGMTAQQVREGGWGRSLAEEDLEAAGLWKTK